MKTFKTIIIEEDIKDAEQIKNIIEIQCPNIVITNIGVNAAEAKKIIADTTYDIIILGFESGMNYAFEMLQNSPHSLEDKELILIATEKQQQLQCITDTTINFVSRLIKPNNIIEAVEKAEQKIVDDNDFHEVIPVKSATSKPLNVIAIPSIDEVKILKISDILYLQSEGKYTVFHTAKDKTVMSSTNLGEYEKKLIYNNFFRAHNSFLINMDNIVNVQKRDGVYVEMNNRDHIPVAKRKKDALFHHLGIK